MHHGFVESLDFTSDFGHQKGARMGENLSKESLQQAIAENRVLIIPAEIGKTVYHYSLSCFNGCFLQKRKFRDVFGYETGRCGELPCKTMLHEIYEMVVTLDNLGCIIKTWGDSTFATYDEAKAAADEKIKKNISILREYGFKLDGMGRAIKTVERKIWKISGKDLKTLYILADCMDDALAEARRKNPNYDTCQVEG